MIALQGLLSHDMSAIGTSAARVHTRAEHEEWTLNATQEVVTDLLLVSRGRMMCGMMGSMFFRVAVAMAISQGRLIFSPIAMDASYEWPFAATHFDQRQPDPSEEIQVCGLHSIYNLFVNIIAQHCYFQSSVILSLCVVNLAG